LFEIFGHFENVIGCGVCPWAAQAIEKAATEQIANIWNLVETNTEGVCLLVATLFVPSTAL
jgi:hypothetical protein